MFTYVALALGVLVAACLLHWYENRNDSARYWALTAAGTLVVMTYFNFNGVGSWLPLGLGFACVVAVGAVWGAITYDPDNKPSVTALAFMTACVATLLMNLSQQFRLALQLTPSAEVFLSVAVYGSMAVAVAGMVLALYGVARPRLRRGN